MLKSVTVVSYISAASFDAKLDHTLDQLAKRNCQVQKVVIQHNWLRYAASVLYEEN